MTPHAPLLEPAGWWAARWAFASVVVAGLHAGGVLLAIMQWPEAEISLDAPGVITMELAPVATSARASNPDLAPGPLMTEAAPASPVAKHVEEEAMRETPRVNRSPAPNPAVALPEPKPEEKKPDEKPAQEKTAQERKVEQAMAAPATTAPVKIDAPTAMVTAAPAQGTSNAAVRALATWHRALINQLELHKRYPLAARARHEQGAVMVHFSIDRGGRLVSAEVLKSSGSRLLDEEALAMLHRASPLPAPPASIEGDPITRDLPVQFSLK